MVEIYLDNQQLEVAEDVSIGLTVSIADIEDPTSCKTAFTKTIDVPMTTHNRAIMQHCEEVLSPYNFNTSEHVVAVYQDGVELIKGKAYYDGTNGDYYQIQVVYEGFDWVNRIKDKALNEIDDEKVSMLTKYDLLSDEQRRKIFFGLINHGCWHQEINDTIVPRLWATYADLVPFISFEAILQSIFKGYKINEEIYDNEEVRFSLQDIYITGKFKELEGIDAIREDNAFEVSCNGVNVQKVQFNNVEYDALGVLVDRDATGDEAQYVECFDNVEEDTNNRISVEEREITLSNGDKVTNKYLYFEPTQNITTAFNIHLKYASQFYVKANQLVFADTIHFNGLKVATIPAQDCLEMVADNMGEPLNNGTFNKCKYPANVEANLTTSEGNINIDIPDSQMTYFCIELDHPELYDEVVQISWYQSPNNVAKPYYVVNQEQVLTTDIHKKMFVRGACNFEKDIFNIPGTTNTRIGLRTIYGDIVVISDNKKACYMLDFLAYKPNLFEGEKLGIFSKECSHFEEYQNVTAALYKFTDADVLTFDLKLQTSGYALSNIEPLPLQVGFTSSNGTELNQNEKMLVTVAEGSTLSPLFNSVQPYGYRVSLNDVGGDIKAVDVLKSIMQMYNLRIMINPDKREVSLFNYAEYYTSDIVDWSDRIDLDKGVSVSNIADSIGKEFMLTYQSNSAPVEYYNRRNKEPYLSWRTPINTLYTEDTYELQSSFNPPMFKKASEVFGKGGDDNMLDVADRNAESTIADWNVNDVPTTVVLVKKSDEDTEYPVTLPTMGVLEDYRQPEMKADGSTGEDTGGSLSFKSLRANYDSLIDTWNNGKRIECYCRILPQEIEALNKYGMTDLSFRSKFKLHINGEDIFCRLEAIENYEPQNATHKCIFFYQ